ncbi:MAG TPA: D-alanyl-D-alanine carboxypeptidase [Gammaproteobacteria bacterium]|nr:D-alanyl-D-alanine carboxypeptidase [Gammaproteobacteria bacterium]
MKPITAAIVTLFLLCSVGSTVHAVQSELPVALQATIPPPNLKVSSWTLMDASTGVMIAAAKPDRRVEPASLSKLMTAYLVFRGIDNGAFRLDEEVVVSENAWRSIGSRMFIEPGDRVSIENLIKGLVVQSGNDAAVALAEYVAGSEAAFVEMMNQAAAGLNLNGTNYVNSTGLPHPDHFSTARDISRLAGVITQQFPEYYRYYSIKEFGWKGIHQKNRNKLLWRDETIDGVKTGHTRSAGYCLVGSAERGGMRLIASVLGAQSKTKRADAVYALLRYGFASYDSKTVYRGGSKIVTAKVYKSVSPSLAVGVGSDIRLTLPKTPGRQLDADIRLNEPLVAPIVKGSTVGTLTLRLNGDEIGAHPLVALGDAVPGSWEVKAYDTLRLWVR